MFLFDSLICQIQGLLEMQDTAWQPGVPELAEQMGNTVTNLLSEISKLREELVASDGRVQKLNVENERLRQLGLFNLSFTFRCFSFNG